MPWHKLSAGQHRALLQKSMATRRSQILDPAAEVGPAIEAYHAQGLRSRRTAALLNLSGYSPLRGATWHPTTVVRRAANLHGPARTAETLGTAGVRHTAAVTRTGLNVLTGDALDGPPPEHGDFLRPQDHQAPQREQYRRARENRNG